MHMVQVHRQQSATTTSESHPMILNIVFKGMILSQILSCVTYSYASIVHVIQSLWFVDKHFNPRRDNVEKNLIIKRNNKQCSCPKSNVLTPELKHWPRNFFKFCEGHCHLSPNNIWNIFKGAWFMAAPNIFPTGGLLKFLLCFKYMNPT